MLKQTKNSLACATGNGTTNLTVPSAHYSKLESEARSVLVHRSNSDCLLTRRQVAERLGVCVHTVQRLTRKGLLPALVFNSRFIRYNQDVVEALIAQAKVG